MSVLQDKGSAAPQVWIGCLASYNAGRLIGEWCDATDLDAMHECRDRVAKLAKEAACREWPSAADYGSGWLSEEFFIADYDGFPRSLVSRWGEYPDWEEVAEVCAVLVEDPEGVSAWLAFADHALGSHYWTVENLRDWREYVCASGVSSEEEYAQEFYESCYGEVEGELAGHIDWESYAQTFFRYGTHYLVDGYVFDSEAGR